jgi:diguanylate cyclase (GGDEF)-like protein
MQCPVHVLQFKHIADKKTAMQYPVSESVIQTLSSFFKSNTFLALRLIAGLITLLVLLGYSYIPPRVITVFPNTLYPHTSYVGANGSHLVSENGSKLSCNYKQDEFYSCGFALTLSKNVTQGLNLEDFDGVIINTNYTGDSNRFRIAMRNHNPVYSKDDPEQKSKYMLTYMRSSDFNTSAFVKLSEFIVSEWWTRQNDIPREHASPEFSNVISISFDFVDAGHHDLIVNKVELVGAWISKEALYLTVLLFWMSVIIGEGLVRFIVVYIESKRANQRISEMTENYRQLELEKKEFETLSTTDKLTGITNRAGIDNFVRKIFESNYEKSNLGIIIFDIDHFKKINDTKGHDVGDVVLKGLAKLIATNIREVDVFGRWGGEEFVIIAPQTTKGNLANLAEKLRACVEVHNFDPTTSLQITISMGIAAVKHDESFENALKRADLALYAAKNNGRNCISQSPDT